MEYVKYMCYMQVHREVPRYPGTQVHRQVPHPLPCSAAAAPDVMMLTARPPRHTATAAHGRGGRNGKKN